MSEAKRDGNNVPTMLGVSNIDFTTPTPIRVNPATGAIIANAATLPSQTGNAGKFLETNGSSLSWQTAGGAYVRGATKIIAASNSLDTTNADYICTGTNDHTTINTALSALLAGGGRVLLMEGTYNLGGAITITKSKAVLEGQGVATLLKLANSINTDCIQIGDGSNAYTDIWVRNLQIDGNYTNNTTGTIHSINVKALATLVKIEGCKIINSSCNAIVLNASDAIVINNYLDTSSTTKDFELLAILSGAVRSKILGNSFANPAFTAIAVYADDAEVASNIVLNSSNDGFGMYFSSINVTAQNNIIKSCKKPVEIDSNQVTFSGNIIIQDVTPSQELLLVAGGNCIIGNNYVDATGISSAAITGIGIYGSDCQITNNSVFVAGVQSHQGIVIHNITSTNVSGNIVSSSSARPSGSTGISAGGSTIVAGNVIEKFELGIDATSMPSGNISGNYLESVLNGILLTGAQNTSIIDNYININTNDGYGIKADNSSVKQSLVISENKILNPGQDGISLKLVQYVQVTNNQIVNPGVSINNTYSGILLTDNGASFSTYNVVSANIIQSSSGNLHAYGIRENAAGDGPNVVTNNICLNAATTQISTQNANTDVSHNITT